MPSSAPAVQVADFLPLFPGEGPLLPQAVEQRNQYQNLAAAATTVLKSGPGFLHSVTINNPGATGPLITIYDNTAASGSLIATITPTAHATLHFDVEFFTGLTVVLAGTTPPNVTFSFR